jgi:hypothetical protein
MQTQYIISLTGLAGDAVYSAVAQSIVNLRSAAAPNLTPITVETDGMALLSPRQPTLSTLKDDFRAFLKHFNARSRFNRLPIDEIEGLEPIFVLQQASGSREMDLAFLPASEGALLAIIQSLKGDKYFSKLRIMSAQLTPTIVQLLTTTLKFSKLVALVRRKQDHQLATFSLICFKIIGD